MNKNILLAGAALSVVPTLMAAKAPQKRVQPKQPNIIFILCDDMGYGDLACYGQPYISTPNIDRMAEEGMRFTQAYAGSPVSAPSRASIMTGQHSGHGHVRGNREYWSAEHTVMYDCETEGSRITAINCVQETTVNGATDFSALDETLAQGGLAGLIVQQPNRYGIVEDYTGVADRCHAAKALLIINSVAADLSMLKTPGEWGADIAVGEGQSLGIPLSWGGPYIGYMCTTEKHMRKMPGRIVGQTVDHDGKRAFVLTLQAREQHIRRQRATSNICSNQGLMALWVTIYMSLMGPQGLKEATQMGCDGAHYLHDQLIATGHFCDAFPGQEFLNEFCVKYDGDLAALQEKWVENGFMGGVAISDDTVMFAVTEQRTKEEIDQLVALIS